VLRRSAGKRPPLHSYERRGAGFYVQTQAFSSECSLVLKSGKGSVEWRPQRRQMGHPG